jgi:tetratricopeptide (TPR) repeat protein
MEEVHAAARRAELKAILRRAEQAALASHWDEAVDALNAGLASEPENEILRAKLAEVRKAKREARLQATLRLADTAAQAGKWETAIEALDQFLAVEPENADVQKKLVETRQRQRESHLNALRSQARGLARADKFDEALAAWQEYLALEPDDREKAQAEVEKVKQVQALAQSYTDASEAFTKKNYDQAISLLKGVVAQDVNYREASRLLAESIEMRRTARRWWQSRWLWGAVGVSLVLVVGWLAIRPGSPLRSALFAYTSSPSGTAAAILPPEEFATVALSPTVTPTPLPYTWVRLNSGQFLPRDTITAIVVDPTDPGVLYVGTENAGVYKSIDGGLSWQPMHTGLGRAWIHTLVMDSENNGRGDQLESCNQRTPDRLGMDQHRGCGSCRGSTSLLHTGASSI